MASSTIDQMSLFIPRVDTRSIPQMQKGTKQEYEEHVKAFILAQFHEQNIGHVERVDLVEKLTPDSHKFYIAFVHFVSWYDSIQSTCLQEALLDTDRKAILQYHPKWYWIVNKNINVLTANEVILHKTISDQAIEIEELRLKLAAALGMYDCTHVPEVVMNADEDKSYDQFLAEKFPPIRGTATPELLALALESCRIREESDAANKVK